MLFFFSNAEISSKEQTSLCRKRLNQDRILSTANYKPCQLLPLTREAKNISKSDALAIVTLWYHWSNSSIQATFTQQVLMLNFLLRCDSFARLFPLEFKHNHETQWGHHTQPTVFTEVNIDATQVSMYVPTYLCSLLAKFLFLNTLYK